MQKNHRLINYFKPTNYLIDLKVDRVGRRFQGTVTITGTALQDKIAFHAKGLTISSVSLNNDPIDFKQGDYDEAWLQSAKIASKEVELKISYRGQITDGMHGLYPCHYRQDGQDKELLITQFESHYAREMVPCLDEPEAKATFDLTVTTEKDITVLSNMPIKSMYSTKTEQITEFERTPHMSTYLLALVIGDLQVKSAKTKGGVEVNVYATPNHNSTDLDYALGEAVDIIEFFNDYFGVDYPLPKSDHVAVPDFANGAMENWGLITYRETALLANQQTSSIASRQYVTSVIAHELSHQWFGNLVTMKWWNNLWLNESFASVMENVPSEKLHKSWDVWLDFASGDAISALRRDSIEGVQAVQTDVSQPDEIQSIFDGAIVYAKGARLLVMLRAFVGEKAFRAGLTSYFKKHSHQNTTENDLWDAMSQASGKDIASLMNAWILQPGYPVVKLELDNGQLKLAQNRFLTSGTTSTDTVWPIPLGASTDSIPTLFAEKSLQIDFDQDYVYLNKDNSTHFITQYSDKLFSKILDKLKSGQLSTIQRLQILNEQILLSRASLVPASRLVDTVEVYREEDQEPVWSIVAMTISELRKYVEQDKTAERGLKDLAFKLSQKQYTKLGWEEISGESDNDKKLRSLVLSQMVYAEDQDVINEAIRRSKQCPIDQLDPEIRSILLGVNVRYGDDKDLVQKYMSEYQQTISPDIKDDLRSAIVATIDPDAIDWIIGKLKDKKLIRPQDAIHWFIYLLSNRHARDKAWHWLLDNWSWVVETFGSDKSYDYYPRYAGQLLTTRRQLDQYREFFGPKAIDISLKRAIEMGITELTARVELIERNKDSVAERLINL